MSQHKAKNRKKAVKKAERRFFVFLCVSAVLLVIWIILGIFLFYHKATPVKPDSIYISSENVKQGDTVFIKVLSNAKSISGNFGQEKLFFYKNSFNEWFSFLGVDADIVPGNYPVTVNSGSVKLIKNIKVSMAKFSEGQTVEAPAITKNGYTADSAILNIRNKDNPVLNKVISSDTALAYFNSSFSFPLSKMQSHGFSFGEFIGLGKYKIQHLGVDLAAPENTNIYSVNAGKVVLTENLSNYGNTVVIDHGLGIFSLYLHLDKFKVSNGQIIKKGQLIGLSGDTGYTTGAHLHFSMRVAGARVDPLEFIKTSQQCDF